MLKGNMDSCTRALWKVLVRFGLCCTFVPVFWLCAAQAQTDALSQQPQPVPSAQDSKTPGLSQLPTLELSSKVSELDVLPYAQYWIDSEPNTTLDAVEARASAGVDLFKPASSVNKYFAHSKVLWLRFEVRTLDTRSRWLLNLDSPTLDNAQLFWRDTNNQWMSLKAGDAVARAQWPLHNRTPVFGLQSDAQASVLYYLRIENARVPVSVPIHIYRDSHYAEHSQTANLLIGGLLGLILAIFSAASLLAVQSRDKAMIAFVIYLLVASSFIATNLGLTPQYLWNESPRLADRMNYVLACLNAAVLPSLVRVILQPVIGKRWFDAALLLLIGLMLCVAAFEAFAPSVLSYRVMNIGALASMLFLVAQAIAAWQRGTYITRWIALCIMPMPLAAIPLIFRNVGWIANSWVTQYALILAVALSIPFLLYGLILRSAQRREALARAAGLPKQDALTGLPNMRAFLEVLHSSQTRAQRFKQRFGMIVVDLHNHSWFGKEHGQEMADRALILSSTRLQKNLRDVDMICRLDKHQFAILVEGPCTLTQLSKLSAQIAAQGHLPSKSLPVGASLKFLLTCALLPCESAAHVGDDANDLLAWLIHTAEEMPVENHKMVRMIDW
jgi:two-component system, sensor histidine kinase LadS